MYSPSFASGGAAVFFHAQTANGSALKRAERGDGGVLHVVYDRRRRREELPCAACSQRQVRWRSTRTAMASEASIWRARTGAACDD